MTQDDSSAAENDSSPAFDTRSWAVEGVLEEQGTRGTG
jgi:hypothetical protein